MFGTNQAVAALVCFRSPELAALTLPDGIPGNHYVASSGQSLTQRLIMKFPIGSMPRRHQDSRMLCGVIVWNVNQRTYVDRKSTRLNSSHSQISYAVFCLKKKKIGSSGSLCRCIRLYVSVAAQPS